MINLPQYDDMQKWARFFTSRPWWQKLLLVVVIVICLYVWFDQVREEVREEVRELKSQNSQLKQDIGTANRTISDLRDRKDELHRENLYYKNTLGTFEEKAEQLYPELETAAALSKLADDLDKVRALAVRDVYKPLAPNVRAKVVASLTALQEKYGADCPVVEVSFEGGSRKRDQVANDLIDLLRNASFKPIRFSKTSTFRKGTPPALEIKLNPKDIPFVEDLAQALHPFLKTRIHATHSTNHPAGTVKIIFQGDPNFRSDGSVTFE